MSIKIKALIIFILFLSVGLGAQNDTGVGINKTNFGVLSGRVSVLGYPMPNTTLLIKGKGFKKKIKSDKEGNYKIALPSGFYLISSKEKDYFYSYQRAGFFVKSEQEIIIDVLLPSKFGRRYSTTYGDGRDVYPSRKKPMYDKVSPVGCLKTKDILVSYLEKAENENYVKYEDAVLTYGKYTFNSKDIKFYKKKKNFVFKELTFIDMVFIHLNGKVIFSSRATLEYDKGVKIEIDTKKEKNLEENDKTITISESC